MHARAALAAAGVTLALAGAGISGARAAPQEAPVSGEHVPAIIEADAHYARRAEGHVGARASSVEISEAIGGYERAAADPKNAEARWKLARALYFLGSYTGLDSPGRLTTFTRARRFGEEAIVLIGERKGNPRIRSLPPESAAQLVAGDPDAAPAYFWTAVAWGQWALESGRFESARQGAASRIRDDCLTLIRFDPKYDDGGGYRVLGRLHDRAPRIPLLTGWVSRSEALRNLHRAVEVAPANTVNRHFLAEALHRGDHAEKQEAIRMEEQIAAETPAPNYLVEVLAIQEQAKADLESWRR